MIRNIISGKKYIGQTTQPVKNRWSTHCCNSGCPITKDIKKYGKENFEFRVLSRCNNREEMDHREAYYIKLFNAAAPVGYNVRGILFSPHTESAKDKISKKLKGRVLTEDWKRKISVALAGRKLPYRKRTYGGGFKGKRHSEETKLKMRMAKLKRTQNVDR